jgi:hypothetical protein
MPQAAPQHILKRSLRAAEAIALAEINAAKLEEDYNLANSVRERTEVRRKTAEKIAAEIRKAMRP